VRNASAAKRTLAACCRRVTSAGKNAGFFFKKGYQVLGFLAGLKDFKFFLYEDRTRKDDPKANGLSKHRI